MTERMVPLSRLSERIKIEPYYYKIGLNGTHNECYVRSEVATQLLKVVTFLPEGIGVNVWDGWRSFETQLAIYEATKKELMYPPSAPISRTFFAPDVDTSNVKSFPVEGETEMALIPFSLID